MKRTMLSAAILLSAATVFASAGRAAPRTGEPNAAAVRLVERAVGLSDIQGHGATAFRLRARIVVDSPDGKVERGRLVRIWTPEGLEHREQSLGGYHRVEVIAGGRAWVASNLPYVPFPMFLAERALNLHGELRAARGGYLSGPFRAASGVEKCVRSRSEGQPVEFCFDPGTGELRRLVNGPWNVTFEFTHYEPFDGWRFPRLLRVLRNNGRVFVEIRVDGLEALPSPDLRAFLPVKGSRERALAAQCRKIEAAKLVKMVRPEYPKRVQNAGLTGVVRLYAEIGADGVPRGMWSINRSLPALREASIAAVRQWRYRPQTCKTTGKKMSVVSPITILFVSH